MEDAIATKATSALNDGLGVGRELKELDIKWGIEYGILSDAFDDLRTERDRYRAALEQIETMDAENIPDKWDWWKGRAEACAAIAREALDA